MGRPRQHHFIDPETMPASEAVSIVVGGEATENFPAEDVTTVTSQAPEVEKVHEKITSLKDTRWRDIDSGATSGMPHYVSDTGTGDGTLAIYKRTRAFANKRWKEIGKFVDFMTGVDLPFEPKYCRNRYE